jgi:diguanylate cyclase (GGDEF)-like protein
MGTADRQVAGVPMTEEEGTTDQGSVRTMVRLARLRPEPDGAPARERAPARREAGWAPRAPSAENWRRTLTLTYLIGVIGILGMWSLKRAHLVEHRPLWSLLLILAGAGACGWVGETIFHWRQSATTVHLRVACETVSVTAVIYLIGWGPALAIGGVYPLLNTSIFLGARRRWTLVVWPMLCLSAGQAAVASGYASLLISRTEANGLAVVDFGALLFVWSRIIRLTDGKELAERELTLATSHDSLTGLLNRPALASRLQGLVAGQNRAPRPVAVLCCDMLGFKDVNDSFGHEAGDRALAEVSKRLRATCRAEDLVARFAGDEFVVALASTSEPSNAVSAAERVLDALEVPVRLGSGSVLLRMSIGIAFSSTGTLAAERLLSEADQAMYEAKALHRSSWVLRQLD